MHMSCWSVYSNIRFHELGPEVAWLYIVLSGVVDLLLIPMVCVYKVITKHTQSE